jgi:predicted permease
VGQIKLTNALLTLRTSLPVPKYEKTERRVQFYSRVLSEVRALPGVSDAAYTSFLPVAMGGGIWPVIVPGHPEETAGFHLASLRFVTPGFFETMGIPLRAGRSLSESDTAGSPLVAVVSESFVRKYWPGQDPLGRAFKFALSDRIVAGVVGDVRVRGLERTSEPQVYLPYKQVPDGGLIFYAPKDLIIRSSAEPGALIPAIRQIIRNTDPEQPVSDVREMTEIVAADTAPRLVQVRVLGAFAAIAFLLAAVGIHGLLSFAVSNRTKEIGVRVALGARSGDIVWMVLRDGVVLAAIGVSVGVVLAYWSGRALEALLAGVRPDDAMTFGSAVALCLIMTMAGSLVPAIRAVRVDPATVIRAE